MADEASSLVGILKTTVELKASPEKFYEMFVVKKHHVSIVASSDVQRCDLLNGEEGQVGAVVVWYYFHDGEAKVMKEVTESIDPENNGATYRVLEGDLMNYYKTFVITFQVTPKEGEPGSVAHWHFEYERFNEQVAHPESLLQFFVKVSKEIDGHL